MSGQISRKCVTTYVCSLCDQREISARIPDSWAKIDEVYLCADCTKDIEDAAYRHTVWPNVLMSFQPNIEIRYSEIRPRPNKLTMQTLTKLTIMDLVNNMGNDTYIITMWGERIQKIIQKYDKSKKANYNPFSEVNDSITNSAHLVRIESFYRGIMLDGIVYQRKEIAKLANKTGHSIDPHLYKLVKYGKLVRRDGGYMFPESI